MNKRRWGLEEVWTEKGWVRAAFQCVFNVCVFMRDVELCVCVCDVLF